MMLNIKFFNQEKHYIQYIPIAIVISLIFFLEIFMVFDNQIVALFEPTDISYFE